MFWRMNHRQQRAMRQGSWKYLRVDGHDYLFDLTQDARERANQARREPQRLQAMREAWLRWNAQIPPVPPEARVHLAYTLEHMPAR